MRDEEPTLFRPTGFSTAADVNSHQEAEVAVGVSPDEEAHRCTSVGLSLLYPQLRDVELCLLPHKEAGFPQGLEVNTVAQHGHQHSPHQHLLPRVEQMEDDKVLKSSNNLFRT